MILRFDIDLNFFRDLFVSISFVQLPPRPKRIHSAPQSRSRLNTRNSGFSTQTQLFDIQG